MRFKINDLSYHNRQTPKIEARVVYDDIKSNIFAAALDVTFNRKFRLNHSFYKRR